jgi:hypothetical protein
MRSQHGCVTVSIMGSINHVLFLIHDVMQLQVVEPLKEVGATLNHLGVHVAEIVVISKEENEWKQSVSRAPELLPQTVPDHP